VDFCAGGVAWTAFKAVRKEKGSFE
jgi:hypothetical protein